MVILDTTLTMKHNKTLLLLNIFGLLEVLTVNALANILPINGYNTGQVSAFYPSLFTPAGFTFSVWSLLYLLQVGFVIYQYKVQTKEYITELSYWFLVSCVANASWILAWHYLLPMASVVIMLVLLYTLTKIFLLLQRQSIQNIGEKLLIKLPFTFYLSWICVATIANISALLVHWQWDGGMMTPVQWTVVMISIASLLGIAVAWRFRESLFLPIIIWALFGIFSKWQGTEFSAIANAARIGLIVLATALVIIGLRSLRKIKDSPN